MQSYKKIVTLSPSKADNYKYFTFFCDLFALLFHYFNIYALFCIA